MKLSEPPTVIDPTRPPAPTGLRRDMSRFLAFWFAMYLLNLNSSVMFKLMAIVTSTTSVGQTMAGLIQVVFFLFSGYLRPWSVMPQGLCVFMSGVMSLELQGYSWCKLCVPESQGPTRCLTLGLRLSAKSATHASPTAAPQSHIYSGIMSPLFQVGDG